MLADWRVRRQADQRNCRALGLGDTRNDVGRAAATWPFADADLARDAGVDVGHERRRPLIAGHHVRDSVLLVAEGVVERDSGIAGQAEDVGYVAFNQYSGKRTGSLHCRILPEVNVRARPP